jgi:hypothetical protein
MQEQTKQTITQIRNLMIEQDSRDETSIHLFFQGAARIYQFIQHIPGNEKSIFSLATFENPDLLFSSGIETDDILMKTWKIFLRLLPILVLNVLMIVVSVVKLERMDIR